MWKYRKPSVYNRSEIKRQDDRADQADRLEEVHYDNYIFTSRCDQTYNDELMPTLEDYKRATLFKLLIKFNLKSPVEALDKLYW